MKEQLTTQIGQALETIHQKKPLVHHITNYVTVNDCANMVLAIGASPIMADDIAEVTTITAMASSVTKVARLACASASEEAA